MKIAIMQPYFLPYIGYFQLLKAVDNFIVFDDVNFIKKGWINRNTILVNGQKKMFTIAIKNVSQNKHINELEIVDNFIKLRKTIEINYARAPYYKDAEKVINNILSYDDKQLANFIMHSLMVIMDYLHINTNLILSSTLTQDCTLKGHEKIKQLCSLFEPCVYINAIGGQALYNKFDFKQSNIELYFLQPELVIYKQFKNEFIPYMSFIDVLMFNSVENINHMLDIYTLI